MGVVPLRPQGRQDEACTLVRDLIGGPGPIADLAEQALARQRSVAGRSLADAALDVVTCWLLDRGTRADHAQVLRIWAPKIGGWSRATVGRGVEGDDVAQEVVCRLAAHLSDHRDGLALGQWIWRTTYLVLRESERRSWWPRWVDRPLAALHDPTPSVPEALEGLERRALVTAILQDLRLEDRLLLWGAYVDGCDRLGLAHRFGWPVGTVNRRMTRARRAFREAARGRGIAGDLP